MKARRKRSLSGPKKGIDEDIFAFENLKRSEISLSWEWKMLFYEEEIKLRQHESTGSIRVGSSLTTVSIKKT